ncbi:hypothetical protein DL89DRAFT_177973 [Linderina pennispora]|uniref:Secreted protein n=1 Tax=Linderina pennispora TaxID=61395 RepID=A0A1Y1W4Z1_9FUNG|nr:uncharacterized protein DL89DRAFT_177973 [Linderina pennispora]ORX68468.1 hypothetical protein DL89DRAFT_177973 [Linderina pennispora]
MRLGLMWPLLAAATASAVSEPLPSSFLNASTSRRGPGINERREAAAQKQAACPFCVSVLTAFFLYKLPLPYTHIVDWYKPWLATKLASLYFPTVVGQYMRCWHSAAPYDKHTGPRRLQGTRDLDKRPAGWS